VPDALVLIVGAPRSGTTWLQSMLGSHPDIATPQETDLFEVYLKPVVEAWDRQVDVLGRDDGRRRKGLPLILTRDEFDRATGALVDTTMAAIKAMKPGANVMLEKSPSHSRCVDIVRRYRPDAKFIHLLRDGRDVTASLVAASADWGSFWAPDSVSLAARRWVENVQSARGAASSPEHYFEVRYEDLRGPDGAAHLQKVFEFCGIALSANEIQATIDDHAFERMQKSEQVSSSLLVGGEGATVVDAKHEPAGFYRRGKVGGWRDEWSVADRRAFASVGGPLLIELGYEPNDAWIGAGKTPPLTTRAAHRAANTTARALRTIADTVERLPRRSRRR
jgi:hypothetical protein